jgi:secondary thiamine-phosphate synthase enzyme
VQEVVSYGEIIALAGRTVKRDRSRPRRSDEPAKYVEGVLNMTAHTEYLWFNTSRRREYVNITHEVRTAVRKSGVREGLVLVSAMHITAGVWVNDAEDGIIADIDEMLERLAPRRPDYRHHATGEDNADAHLKSILIHHQAIVPVTGGDLDLGPWQQIYYAEFDGQRRKRVVVKVLGE